LIVVVSGFPKGLGAAALPCTNRGHAASLSSSGLSVRI
jgi:hypothetical protein